MRKQLAKRIILFQRYKLHVPSFSAEEDAYYFCKNEILTYADMFRLIIKLTKTKSSSGYWDIIFDSNEQFNTMSTTGIPFACLRNNDDVVVNFFKDWEQMQKLYNENIIDEHLYDLWLLDKLKQFENKRLRGYDFLNIPDGINEELPFD